jgi:hypothetical protein
VDKKSKGLAAWDFTDSMKLRIALRTYVLVNFQVEIQDEITCLQESIK